MYSSINSIYFLTPFLISSTYINSSAVWDLVESPGPNLIELHLIFAWSDRVGDPYFVNPSLFPAFIILWFSGIEDELRSKFLGTTSQSNSSFNTL
jgi:hypothetical protein